MSRPEQIMHRYRVSNHFHHDAVMRDGPFSLLDEADSSHAGALVYCQNLHYLQKANENPHVAAIICPRPLADEAINPSKAVILDDDPRRLFFQVYDQFHKNGWSQPCMEFGIGENCSIHPSAIVSAKALIGNRVEIGAHAVIEDFSRLMDNVSIGPNAVIGAEGLITLRHEDGSLHRIKHAGGVEIGTGSQVFAGAVIAKSLFPTFTRVGKYCQIGITANIGHGVSIGDESVISGNSVIAGRTRVGRKVWVGASASVAQGLHIGDGAQIKMGAVVINDIAAGQVVSGNFATSHKINMMRMLKVD